MRRKNAAVLMTAVIIGGLLTSCGSAYNNANGKNSDNTVETQTTVRTVVNGETKTDGNNVKTADKETVDFTQEVTSEENNLTDSDIAGNTEASEQQAFDDLSQADDYKNIQMNEESEKFRKITMKVVREMITRIVMGNHMVTEIHRIIAKKQIFRLQVKMLILIITCLRVHRLTQLHIAHMPMKF